MIEVLFEDDGVIVVNKPSGLSVHRGWDADRDVALFRVRDHVGHHVHPVHRLDRGTSGALLFAKTAAAAAALSRGFQEGRVEKGYLALVRGGPPAEGIIDYAIPKSEGGPRALARTRFWSIQRSPVDRCALVLAAPETGRLHQVRRHLRSIDHPIVGDVRYGNGGTNRHFRAGYGVHRLALHAWSLTFDLPATGARVTVTAPVPDDLGRALAALGLPVAPPRGLGGNGDRG